MPERASDDSSRFGSTRGEAGFRLIVWGSRDSILPGSPGTEVRLRLISTATVFDRPWEKFWRTRPCSTAGRFMLNVRPIPCLLPVSLVSLMILLSIRAFRFQHQRLQRAVPHSEAFQPSLL